MRIVLPTYLSPPLLRPPSAAPHLILLLPSLPTIFVYFLQERLGLRHVCVGDVVAQHSCYDGRDDELDTMILDEDRLLDALEAILTGGHQDDEGAARGGSDDDHQGVGNGVDSGGEQGGESRGVGGIVMDYHSSDLFPERWFDLVLVLRCDTAVLYDRLTARAYSERKRSENVTAEIMNVALDEAREAYDPRVVHEVPSNTLAEMESNVERVRAWMEQWIRDNPSRGGADSGSGSSDDDGDEVGDSDDDDDDDN
jgi:adenylate kinase